MCILHCTLFLLLPGYLNITNNVYQPILTVPAMHVASVISAGGQHIGGRVTIVPSK